MDVDAAAVEVAPPRRALRSLVTNELRNVLEQRSFRFIVVGTTFGLAFFIEMLPSRFQEIDSGWMFLVPVAISAIAGGFIEGVVVAAAASALAAAIATAVAGQIDLTVVVGIVVARFALYGMTAMMLGPFAEAHRALQSHLRQLASMDPLTKVANVASFYDQLDVLEADRQRFVVMVIDLDDLKALNDRYGHQAGSAAIQLVANVLRRVVRTSDCVARYGGDEFVVILKDADRAGAQIVMNRVTEILREEMLPALPQVHVTVSMGAALYGEDGTSSEELLAAADKTMYSNKRASKPRSRAR